MTWFWIGCFLACSYFVFREVGWAIGDWLDERKEDRENL